MVDRDALSGPYIYYDMNGDLIPANGDTYPTMYWEENPDFRCIRLVTETDKGTLREGWIRPDSNRAPVWFRTQPQQQAEESRPDTAYGKPPQDNGPKSNTPDKSTPARKPRKSRKPASTSPMVEPIIVPAAEPAIPTTHIDAATLHGALKAFAIEEGMTSEAASSALRRDPYQLRTALERAGSRSGAVSEVLDGFKR